MDLHDQVECIRLALSERASQQGFVNGDEVVIELQTQVDLDVCVSRDEPNLERALQAAFDRYRQRLSIEAIFELNSAAGSSGSSRVLLKPAISFAPVVPKSARERCDSLARNAESATGAAPRADTATTAVRAVLVPSLLARASAEAEGETQSKKDTNGNTSQRGDKRGNRKSKQTQAEEEVRPAKRDVSPDPVAVDGLLDILRLTRPARVGQGKAKSARLSGTPQRTVVGCSLLLEMYKRGAVGLSFKLKSGAHDHAALRVHLCVALPIRFVEPTAHEMSDSFSTSASMSAPAAQHGAADESVYGAYPFDRSVTSPDNTHDQPPDESEHQGETEDERTVREDVSITELYEALREATIRQLELANQFAVRFSKLNNVSDSDDAPLFELTEPAAFVFRIPQPKDSVTYVSVMYPADVARDAEAPFRELRTELHSALGLSMDRPALRRAQAAFPSRQDAAVVGDDGLMQIAVGNSNSNTNAPRRTCALLPSVHNGVLANEQSTQTQKTELQPRLGLKRAFVRGSYAYFHYVCDGFEDSNWGCAYRSLQTIISWYILNGWTRIGVPTLTEIQRALVACGDQEASLVGSRRWIGSTEVGLALQTVLAADGLDITYKILFVARGSELSSHVRALLAHFELVGTPVMIGGGQYAHTIVGAEFDEMQGRARFMIVDPHYVGPETLPTVLKKGWCAWRDPATFFNDSTFYNLCMPQLPSSL